MPEPSITISRKMPQKTPNAVSAVRSRLRQQRRLDLLPVVEVEQRTHCDSYSSRSASIGRMAAARRAGKKPAIAPATTSSSVAETADAEVDLGIAEEVRVR